MRTRRLAPVFAVALLLATVSGAFASGGSSAESFSVNSSLTVTGIPATIDYGALNPGAESAVQTVPMLVSGNVSWSLAVTGSDFARTPQPGTILANTREVSANQSTWYPTGNPSLNNLKSGGAGGNQPATVYLKVTPPSNAAPGTYAGSVTFTFTAQ